MVARKATLFDLETQNDTQVSYLTFRYNLRGILGSHFCYFVVHKLIC